MTRDQASTGDRLHRALLKDAGFERRRQTWNRAAGDLLQVVALVPSKSLMSLDVILGVCDPDLYNRVWGTFKGFAGAADCLASLSLGELIGDSALVWRPDDVDDARVIISDLETVGIPWLSRMSDRSSILDFLRSRPYVLVPAQAVLLGLLESRLGERAAACQTFADAERRASGNWKDRAREIAAAEGC